MPDPDQPRKEFDQMELLELTTSVKERGIKQPLTVRWNDTAKKYMVIDGGRRYEAAHQAGLPELPCWIQNGDRKDVLIDQIVHNWQRSNLRPMETADALARLRDEFGFKQSELCKVIGKGKSEISKFLALHDKVSPEVQDLARGENSVLSKRHLYSISKLSRDKQLAALENVRSRSPTAEATERMVTDLSNVRNQNTTTRQRFETKTAVVLITFRKNSSGSSDVRKVLREVEKQL